ncbi:MAG: nucleotide exchange factor GrpE [Chthoniobacterales bacterium]|nr:nucleotide exchange factor GrpE [Chthoniobacterales bacterium]
MKKTDSDPSEGVPSTPEAGSPEVVETPDFQAEAARFKDLALRAQAELENFRKRAIRDKEESIRYANFGLLEKLLPVLDNFELGLDAARSASDTASIVQGMTMVQSQFQEFLKSQGVELISAEGEVFDPTRHEAVTMEFSESVPEGRVVRLLRKGYKLKDRVLRASSVSVSKGVAE